MGITKSNNCGFDAFCNVVNSGKFTSKIMDFFRIETDLTKTMSWRSVSQATKLMDWEGSHSIMGSQLPMNTWDLTIESADRNTWCQYPCWNLLMSSIILQLPHYCYAPWWDPTLMNQPVWLWWVPHSHLFFDGVWGKTFQEKMVHDTFINYCLAPPPRIDK